MSPKTAPAIVALLLTACLAGLASAADDHVLDLSPDHAFSGSPGGGPTQWGFADDGGVAVFTVANTDTNTKPDLVNLFDGVNDECILNGPVTFVFNYPRTITKLRVFPLGSATDPARKSCYSITIKVSDSMTFKPVTVTDISLITAPDQYIEHDFGEGWCFSTWIFSASAPGIINEIQFFVANETAPVTNVTYLNTTTVVQETHEHYNTSYPNVTYENNTYQNTTSVLNYTYSPQFANGSASTNVTPASSNTTVIENHYNVTSITGGNVTYLNVTYLNETVVQYDGNGTNGTGSEVKESRIEPTPVALGIIVAGLGVSCVVAWACAFVSVRERKKPSKPDEPNDDLCRELSIDDDLKSMAALIKDVKSGSATTSTAFDDDLLLPEVEHIPPVPALAEKNENGPYRRKQ